MSSRTHFLSLLVLLCAAFPAQLFRVGLAMAAGRRPDRSRLRAVLRRSWLPAAFLLVAALVWFVAPVTAGLGAPAAWWWWCLVAVLVGAAAPALELGVAAGAAAARGRRVTGVRLHERWSGGAAGAATLATAVAVAIAEEVIFRGVGVYLLHHGLGVPVAVAVSIAAVGYGLNHLYFGALTVLQKTVTGVVFGVLFVAAGYSVLIPVLAHVTQNLVVLTLLPRWTRRGQGRQVAAVAR